MRVLFFGMTSSTSTIVLESLLAANIDVCGVVLAAGRFTRATQPEAIVQLPPPLLTLQPVASQPTIADIGWARGLPVFELRHASTEVAATLAALQPDIACVACFPLRIPPVLLEVPPQGYFNLHPSLLPSHRGSAPLFWAFQAGEEHTGVTIHQMDAQLDSGPIVRQARFALPDGITEAAAEEGTARLGAKLLLEALTACATGTLAAQPQPPGGSYEPWPTAEAWRIGADWSARRAFNFMRGTAGWGQPYRISVGGRELTLAQAMRFDAGATLPAPFALRGEEVAIQCAPGVLVARLAETTGVV